MGNISPKRSFYKKSLFQRLQGKFFPHYFSEKKLCHEIFFPKNCFLYKIFFNSLSLFIYYQYIFNFTSEKMIILKQFKKKWFFVSKSATFFTKLISSVIYFPR